MISYEVYRLISVSLSLLSTCFFSLFSSLGFCQGLSFLLCYCLHVTNFPGGLDGKASAYSVGDPGSVPASGRSSGEGNGNPLLSSCLKIPWTEEPGRLQSMGSQRVGRDWETKPSLYFHAWPTECASFSRRLGQGPFPEYLWIWFLDNETQRRRLMSSLPKNLWPGTEPSPWQVPVRSSAGVHMRIVTSLWLTQCRFFLPSQWGLRWIGEPQQPSLRTLSFKIDRSRDYTEGPLSLGKTWVPMPRLEFSGGMQEHCIVSLRYLFIVTLIPTAFAMKLKGKQILLFGLGLWSPPLRPLPTFVYAWVLWGPYKSPSSWPTLLSILLV